MALIGSSSIGRVVLSLLAVLLASPAGAAPVRISYAAIASNTAGIWMAEGTGAFKSQGLDVQFVYISSSATNVQALMSGSIDVMVGGASGIVSAAARGAPLVAVGSQMNKAPATLYVQPEITEPAQLKGLTLGISRPNSSTHVLSVLMLRKLGSYPRQNGLAIALRELGRIERTLFILDWLRNVELRRRVHAGLNTGKRGTRWPGRSSSTGWARSATGRSSSSGTAPAA